MLILTEASPVNSVYGRTKSASSIVTGTAMTQKEGIGKLRKSQLTP